MKIAPGGIGFWSPLVSCPDRRAGLEKVVVHRGIVLPPKFVKEMILKTDKQSSIRAICLPARFLRQDRHRDGGIEIHLFGNRCQQPAILIPDERQQAVIGQAFIGGRLQCNIFQPIASRWTRATNSG